jgi:hypothetical protein
MNFRVLSVLAVIAGAAFIAVKAQDAAAASAGKHGNTGDHGIDKEEARKIFADISKNFKKNGLNGAFGGEGNEKMPNFDDMWDQIQRMVGKVEEPDNLSNMDVHKNQAAKGNQQGNHHYHPHHGHDHNHGDHGNHDHGHFQNHSNHFSKFEEANGYSQSRSFDSDNFSTNVEMNSSDENLYNDFSMDFDHMEREL